MSRARKIERAPELLPPLPCSLDACLLDRLAEARSEDLETVLTGWMDRQVAATRNRIEKLEGFDGVTPSLSLVLQNRPSPKLTADMLLKAIGDVPVLPVPVRETLRSLAPHVIVGDAVASALARTALRLTRREGRTLGPVSALRSVEDQTDTDPSVVLFRTAIFRSGWVLTYEPGDASWGAFLDEVGISPHLRKFGYDVPIDRLITLADCAATIDRDLDREDLHTLTALIGRREPSAAHFVWNRVFRGQS